MRGFTIALSALGVLIAVAAAVRAEVPLVGPFTRDTYPQAVIDRPLTLPAGMVEGELGTTFTDNTTAFVVGRLPFYDRTNDWDLDLDLRVGITDRLQVEAGTGFSLDHAHRTNLSSFFGISANDVDLTRASLASWSRRVPFRLSFLAIDTEAVDTAVTLTLPFEAFASREVPLPRHAAIRITSGDRRILHSVDLAAPTRWRLLPWLWLQAGENLFSMSTFNGAATFNFDLGLGIQAHPSLAFTLDTRIASVAFDGAGESVSSTLADRGTIALAMIFTPIRCVDFVGEMMLPDVGRGFDSYGLRSAVRVRF